MVRLAFSILLLCCGVPAGAATLGFSIQPVTVCEGSFPSTCTDPDFDPDLISAIYAQIGIDVQMLPSQRIDTLAMPRLAAPNTDTVMAAPALNAFGSFMSSGGLAPNTVYIGATGPRLDLFGAPVQGIARANDPLAPFAIYLNNSSIAAALPPGGSASFRRLNSWVIAHEVGHTLGGRHSLAPPANTRTHLMEAQAYFPPSGLAPRISPANAAAMRSSALLAQATTTPAPAPVPVPPMLPVAAAILLVMAVHARRRRASG